MFYHVVITLSEGAYKGIFNKHIIKTDITDISFLKSRFIDPYHSGDPILTDGRTIQSSDIERLRVFRSGDESRALEQKEAAIQDASNVVIGFRNDKLASITKQVNVTDDFVVYAKGSRPLLIQIDDNSEVVKMPSIQKPSKVFIVHGHDDALIHEVKAFLSSQNIDAVVLREQVHPSMTIIEKLEQCIADPLVGFCLALYSADDEGRRYGIGSEPLKRRARQNVVFEHGLLMGKLGRDKITSIVKREPGIDFELPGDVSGVVYTGHGDGDWRLHVAHMLDDANFDINYKKIR